MATFQRPITEGFLEGVNPLTLNTLEGAAHTAQAQDIVDSWRTIKLKKGLSLKPATLKYYSRVGKQLEKEMAAQAGVPLGEQTPLSFIGQMALASISLSPRTWAQYRQTMLHTFEQRLLRLEPGAESTKDYTTALAALITWGKNPLGLSPAGKGAAVPLNAKAQATKRSAIPLLSVTQQEQLLSHLAAQSLALGSSFGGVETEQVGEGSMAYTNPFKSGALSFGERLSPDVSARFIQVTLVTGLRPVEWGQSEWLPLNYDDISGLIAAGVCGPDEVSPRWGKLVVTTAKRKSSEAQWVRTLVITDDWVSQNIQKHLLDYRLAVNVLGQDPVETAKNHINKVTRKIQRACKSLWPESPELLANLYSFRHQARANLAASYGKFVAAGMLGHTVDTAQDNYVGWHRGNLKLKRGDIQAVVPGQDVLVWAKAEALRHQSRARNRPVQQSRETRFVEQG